ncbi:hypothetical protein [Symmachiella dynata]|uniref:hypothetical protein n=1 Tax=Symmachiella dynata TaxID=2527995 RepID=UPI001187E004|nr:hypothetical protein [Symmachiella dynata]QDT50788.1 hypothetical protein Pan258_48700 [Symmachiella dynata]
MTHSRRSCLLFLMLAALGYAGCGSAKYEERLAATSTMFRHKEKLNKNLQGIFHDKATGIQIRPLAGFDRIPAPEATEGPDGEMIVPELDDRQPPFFLEELPGMIAAWKSPVTAVVGGDTQSSTAYMYVLSSLGPMNPDADDSGFRTLVLDILNRELDTDLSSGSLHESTYPQDSQEGFVPKVAYLERSVVPERLVDDLSMEFSVYFHESGADIVCVMFIFPKNVSGLNDYLNKIELSLQTLAIKSRKSNSESSSGDGSKPARSGGM